MATRVFGPVRGAGVQITELPGDRPIEPGALGFVGYAGVLEKGTPGELIQAVNKDEFTKKVGGIIEDGQLPDSVLSFYDVAAGAGGVFLVRVTDGNEVAAALNLFGRNENVHTLVGTVSAKNGGRWGGQRLRFGGAVADEVGDITETTLDTGLVTFATDELKGGELTLDGVANTTYPIVSNTAAGVITVASDQLMATELLNGGDATNDTYFIELENTDITGDKALAILIEDGEDNPDTEFALTVFVNGVEIKKYPNLSIDPASAKFWESIINDDPGNDELTILHIFAGAPTASIRPANHFGEILTVTTTLLTAIIHEFLVTLSPTGANPTLALGATTDDMEPQTLTITMTSATAFDVVSDVAGAVGSGTVGVLFTPEFSADNTNGAKFIPGFTITNGATILATADIMTLIYKPFLVDALIDGRLFPDKDNAKKTSFRIIDNDHVTITVTAGSDLTADGAPADNFLVESPQEMGNGRDGNADIVDADFTSQAWDVGSSPFNQTEGKNLGLVKFSTPGNTATAVQQAGKAYAEAKNHQYRYEAPANIVTEAAADVQFNETLGRSDYAVASFPSFGSVSDPLANPGDPSPLKEIPLTGMIHGREARIANDFNGFHKAEAGIDATLPALLEIPTGDKILNEELLNPRGINVIKKVKGNFILWGDRTLHLDPTWRFKHQRELMSFYEQVLRESFDFIIFAINDPDAQESVRASLISFFLPEFAKGAVRGDNFSDAVEIKIDSENNTDATRASGDLFVDILLQLADTVERLRIRIGKQGIFEAAV